MPLDNVVRLLTQPASEEGPSFSAGLVYSMQFADALLAHPLPRWFGISAFRNMKDSGLYFYDEISGRAAKIQSHPTCGEPIIYLGTRNDFDFETKMARDGFEPCGYDVTNAADVAREVAAYFMTGVLPTWALEANSSD